MTNNEKIQRAEQLIAEANALLNEVKTNNNAEDVIAKYKEDYCKRDKYFIDSYNKIDCFKPSKLDTFTETPDPYQNYHTEELAKQAKELKDFNDELLAFKYCYDSDYKPNWSDNTKKYYVYYDIYDSKYMADGLSSVREPLVYFSSKEIAQKCADWLNSLSE